MSTGGAGLVPVRIFNTSDKEQIMSAQTVVFVAKPVTSVAGLEIPDQTSDCCKSAAHKLKYMRCCTDTKMYSPY